LPSGGGSYDPKYLIFESTDLVAATSLVNEIAASLGVAKYATVLRDSTSGKFAVPILGAKALAALDSTQQSNLLDSLPDGYWRTLS